MVVHVVAISGPPALWSWPHSEATAEEMQGFTTCGAVTCKPHPHPLTLTELRMGPRSWL